MLYLTLIVYSNYEYVKLCQAVNSFCQVVGSSVRSFVIPSVRQLYDKVLR